jgi:hypothetical protein
MPHHRRPEGSPPPVYGKAKIPPHYSREKTKILFYLVKLVFLVNDFVMDVT